MPIQTKRLVIRKLCEADYPAFEKTLNTVQKESFGGGKKFLHWLMAQYPAMDIINGLVCFGIFEKASGKLAGTIGAGRHDDLHETEIFYYLLPDCRRHGFAAEAVKAVTEWALKNYALSYLIGTVSVDNVRSWRVLERCGYQLVDVRPLLVHATKKRSDFKYYRYYNSK